ncbi:hypothetical protein N7456_013439 [Penicillium angulare]|uniref:Carrier domain-containing protein n=1 Tax=Penicillium angulare TaxID=116970 RepID=A0A9W9EG71_9EURO|nr:hypothetical protein N7456_013439 [Penicillium angulare]
MSENALRPLAVVGLSLKFPQDATSPDLFWDMIMEGRCASTEFPSDRLTINSHYNPDTSRLESLSLRGAHFLTEDLSLFDAPFFSITAGEAQAMDPQQRLVLEASYRALESAGIPMKDVAKSRTCVFVGSSGHDYLMLQAKDPQYMQKWNITGTTSNMVANRVSWFFDLTGPSAAIDTACSSSLMAVDMACQSIWSGDSNMGFAIGSNVLLAMETSLMMDNLGLLSKDSRCFSFDERGNGYSRGEGVGVIIIRPLEDAVRNGDTIRAVIRSSASNQDGKTPGITQPSSKMQARLIEETYRKAKLDMAATRYFEAHGTGTAVGDPIETSAIGSVFRKYRSSEEPLYVGSVKSNIGHLEGGSGIAGFIKTVLALEKGIIPPNSVNLQSLNPRIDDDFLNMNFPQKPLSWPSEGLRRASVSSFGYGGSNTHIVLEDAYQSLKLCGLEGKHNTLNSRQYSKCKENFWSVVGETSSEEGSFVDVKRAPEDTPKLFVWSVADEKGISRLQESWRSWCLKTKPDVANTDFLKSLAYTLSCRRTHLPWRAFAVARPSDSLEKLLGLISSASQSRVSPNLAFIFSGQGAQWYAMGRELLDIYPIFFKSVEGAGDYLKTLGCEWSPIDEFRRDQSSTNVNKTEYSQILCTILQVALVDLLRHLNITPKAVLGHSSGEVAAAYCSRGISRKSAWKISYYRGNMSNALENSSTMAGSMLAVALSEAEAMSYIEDLSIEYGEVKVTVGCINSPKSVTLSGDVGQLESVKIKLEKDNIFCRMLKVKLAYHSSQMKEIAPLYLDALGELESDYAGHKDWPEMISSVTGDWVKPGDTARASHWVNNMISPVRFSDALTTLCSGSSSESHKRLDGGHRRTVLIGHILEVGPHSVLQGACKDVLKTVKRDTSVEYLSLLVRNTSAADTVLAAFGRLFTGGYPLDLGLANGFDPDNCYTLKCLTDLPEYPFNHDVSYWHESAISKNHRFREFPRNDLLGVCDPACNSFENRWRNFVRISEMPWVKDHQKINNTKLYPGAGMLVMAIEAAQQTAGKDRPIAGFNIEEAKFHAAMVVPSGAAGLETSFHLWPLKNRESKGSIWYEFRLCTSENGEWTENCTGSIQVVYAPSEEPSIMDKRHEEELRVSQLETYSDTVKACTLSMDRAFLYSRLHSSGYGYGDAFQLINSLSLSPDRPCVFGQIERFATSAGETIHPTTLDTIMQTSIWTGVTSVTGEIPTAVPTSVEKLWVASRTVDILSSSTLSTYAIQTAGSAFLGSSVSIVAFDETTSEILVSLQGLGTNVVSEITNDDEETQTADDLCHRMQWNPDHMLLTNKEAVNLCRTANPETADPEAMRNDLDFIIMARITEALRIISEQNIKASKPHLQSYVNWMMHRQQLLNDGQIRFASEPWKGRLVDKEYLDSVESRLLNLNKTGYLYVMVARNLLRFLTSELDPSVFLSEGNMLEEHRSEHIHASQSFKQVAKYVELLSHTNSRMKVLEVGAGTGSMTDVLLDTLGRTKDGSRFAQWDFTDVTSSLFSSVQGRLHEEGNLMRFKVLNIEEDPSAQGFECGTYDLVVACLVFHATSNLKTTLRNARKLLKPGGKLMLYEIVIPNIRSTFTFGLLEKFWRSSESYRSLGPCIDTRQWNEMFLQTGYSGLDFHLPDFEGSMSHEFGLLVSTAMDELPQVGLPSEIEIVYDATEPRQRELAQFLVNNHEPVSTTEVHCVSVTQAMERNSEGPLLRVFLLELQKPLFAEIEPQLLRQLQGLLSSTAKVLWINQGGGDLVSLPHSRLVEGLFRVLASEDSNRNLHLLSLEPHKSLNGRQRDLAARMIKFLSSPGSADGDMEYIEQNGVLNTPRLLSADSLNDRISSKTSSYQRDLRSFDCHIPLRLNGASPGLLTGFEFVEDETISCPLRPGDIEIEVKCAGLNFRDILIAVGQLKASNTGSECSGIVKGVGAACEKFKIGDSVAALHDGSFATSIRIDENGPVVKVPEGISYADAAAVPVTFATAYVALQNVARIQPGESVLIHSATGGTGQAAIQIAQNAGATVFATVSTESKKQLLIDVYGIPESNIFSSRSTLFSKMIKLRTGGKGVDVILNSLAGESLFASWECIASYGRFIEIGKRDILSNQRLPMLKFLDNVSYNGVDLAVMSVERPEVCSAALKTVFASMQKGDLHPPHPINLFGIGEIEKAFRLMQTGQHIGKVVLEMRGSDQVKVYLNSINFRLSFPWLTNLQTVLKTKDNLVLDPNATFVISGGLGGLGQNIASWLVDHGARHLLLLSRSGGQSEKGRALIKRLEENGAQVMAPACDISDETSLRNALSECDSNMPRIKGCFQAAMVLRDGLFEGISHKQWVESLSPKVQGSWNLHKLLPQGMDFFIMLSSIAGILGTTGQASYAAGNTFQDALAQHRVGLGEKAISLNLGVFSFAGAVAESSQLHEQLINNLGLKPVTEAQLYALLAIYCDPNVGASTSLDHQVTVGLTPSSLIRSTEWVNRPLTRHLIKEPVGNQEDMQASGGTGVASLLQGSSLAQASEIVTELFSQKLSKALGIAMADIDANKPLHQYGVDSLVAVELRGWFAKELQADLGVFEILGGATLSSVAQVATRKSKLVKTS